MKKTNCIALFVDKNMLFAITTLLVNIKKVVNTNTYDNIIIYHDGSLDNYTYKLKHFNEKIFERS